MTQLSNKLSSLSGRKRTLPHSLRAASSFCSTTSLSPTHSAALKSTGFAQFCLCRSFPSPHSVNSTPSLTFSVRRHDWSDDYCVIILTHLRDALIPGKSRILICDQLMNTTCGDTASMRAAPTPLPANYGVAVRFSHQRDMCMMGIINGIERTPAQLARIVERAGLRIERVWEGRSQVAIVEVTLG